MFFTDQKKLLSENMTHFNRGPEFEKELDNLLKKYRSLEDDLKSFEKVIGSELGATGFGKNFTIIHDGESFKIIKARLMCRSLRNRDIRVIYAYHHDRIEFMYIEIYFKGDKSNEDRERVKEYINQNKLIET